MARFFRRVKNILKEGLKGIWVHRTMGLASVISTFATLFVIGLVIIISVTVNNIAKDIEGKVDEVEVFIKVGTDKLKTVELENKINDFKGELDYVYRSSDEALEIMKSSWGDDSKLLEGIVSDKILPSSFVVSLKDISQADDFVKYIEKESVVDDVSYYQDIVNKAYNISKYVQIFGALLITILMVVSLFIISNTIKLTVYSRQQEISVMRYVGANNNYIRIPFLIEGLFFGVLGSLLAFLAVYFAYKAGYNYLNKNLLMNISIVNLIRPELYKRSLLEIFLALGAGIGVIGGIFSIRKYLKA